MAEKCDRLVDIASVVKKELVIIEKRRNRIYPNNDNVNGVDTDLIGLALSGGGIRSAVTNLGVLYEMSRVGLFRSVDYLSTVSGGGYIGCCISSLLSLTDSAETDDKANQSIYSYSSTDPESSLFTTDWKSFPFRDLPVEKTEENEKRESTGQGCIATDDSPECRNFTSKDQVFHLRDRASFLLPRSLLFGSHVMRAVGAVATSTLLSLLWFFSCITGICALYMLLTFSQWIPADQVVSPVISSAVQVDSQAKTATIAADQSKVLVDPKGQVFNTITGRASAAVKIIKMRLAAQMKNFRKTTFGLLLSLGISGFVWGLCAPLYMKWVRIIYSKHAIESEDLENYIGRKQLKHISLSTVFFLLLILGLFHFYLSAEKSYPDPRLFYLPLFCFFSLMGSFVLYCLVALIASSWNRRSRAEITMSSGIFIYAIIGSCFFALLPALISIGNEAFIAIILVLLGFILRYYFKDGGGSAPVIEGNTISVILTKFTRWVMGMLVPLFILLAVIGVGTILKSYIFPADMASNFEAPYSRELKYLYYLLAVSGFFAALFSLMNFNRISPHVFYKDRLAEAFLLTFKRISTGKKNNCAQHNRMELARNSVGMNLVDLHGNYKNSGSDGVENCAARGPYLLINCTLNLTAVRDLYGFRRQSTSFLFSRCYTGSNRTGYVPTNVYDPPLELARAMTVSGAAVTSVRGAGGTMIESFGCTILGVRLGYWLQNPIAMVKNILPGLWSWRNLFYELFRYTNSRHSHVYLSDGGHCGDNLGLLPLLQRNVKLIIASDAECDKNHEFNSLNNSIRRAYIDQNIKISIFLDELIPDDKGNTARHFTIGRIFYPDRPWQKSWLLVIKNTMTGEESTPILNYKKKSPTFPHETTADQFFSEEQFEVYRSLGREACAKIWKENITIFRSSEWINNPWSSIDTFCENLDKLCNPKQNQLDDISESGINSWDDIIRAIWKSESGDFSDWSGFQKTIDIFIEKLDKGHYCSPKPLMVNQLLRLGSWLNDQQGELEKLDGQYDVPRTWEQFEEIEAKVRQGP